jgi:AcrR family transcriptional regulator
MNSNSSNLRDRHRETTREVILEAAEAAFSKDGLSRTRIEDVAATAGVAVGTIYNHFADREALVRAIVERRREEAHSLMDDALVKAGQAPFAERLEALLTTMTSCFDAHRRFFTLLFEEEAQGNMPRRGSMETVAKRLEKLLAAGVAEHALRKEDAELYPSLLAGMLRGLFTHAIHAKTSAPLVGMVKPMVRLFMEGAAP